MVGFGASSLGAKLDVENVGARFLVTLFFYAVHEVVYFTVARGLVKLTLQWSWGHEIGRRPAQRRNRGDPVYPAGPV